MHPSHLRNLPRHPCAFAVLAVLLASLAACESGTGASARELGQIQLSDSLVVLADADSGRLKVTLLDQDGTPMEQLPSGTVLGWTSRDTSIATVQGGLVMAWRPGETEVYVQAGTVKASARVRVEPVPPTFALVAGQDQTAGRGEVLERKLEVRVVNAHGRGVRDAEVEFAISSGGGTLTPSVLRTDSAGIASASWTLGPALGEQKAEARLTGQGIAPVPFTARALRQIAFVSERDGNAEIYLMYEDGSRQRNLTSHPAADRSPGWLRDGTKIIFESAREGTAQRYSMNADGSNLTRMPSLPSPPVSDPSYRWSPDGTKGVFEGAVGGYGHIYIINADGSGLRDLTNVSRVLHDSDRYPAWSPDGSRIAFIRTQMSISSPGFRWHEHLMVINVDGSGLRAVRSIIDGQIAMSGPDWSPDGRSIAYSSRYRAATQQTEIIDADGTHLRSLPSDQSRVGSWGLTWSPDGRMVTYTLIDGWDRNGGGVFFEYLALANAADGRSVTLLAGQPNPCQVPDFGQPCVRSHSVRWAADGARLAFVRQTSGAGASDSGIYVFAIAGSSGSTRLSTSSAKDHSPAWRP